MIAAGEGIEAATVLTEKLAVLIFIWKLLSAKEQHVFTEMCQTWQLDWV